ncbi:MAG: hypothetical protein U0271_14445 [Polyangiaceae bacterium]
MTDDRATKLNPSNPTHLHAPGPVIPIILIPDILGTRLTDPSTGDLAWNPLGWPIGDSAGQFRVDFDRLQQVNAALEPDDLHLPKQNKNAVKKIIEGGDLEFEGRTIRHYYHLIPDFYDKLAKQLSKSNCLEDKTPEAERIDATPLVYCCGYDWRQDNARSALRLARIVEEALEETGARKAILVAHGMGGLIARYYCRVLGGEGKVATLFLLGCPSQGAPSAYTHLKHGVPAVYANELKNDILTGDVSATADEVSSIAGGLATMVTSLAMGAGGGAVGDFMGKLYLACCFATGHLLTRDQMVYFARQLPSLYQLLPTSTFCRDNPTWLFFDPLGSGVPPTGFLVKFPTTLGLQAMATEAVINAVDPATAQQFHDTVAEMTSAQNSSQPNETLLAANSIDLTQLAAVGAAAMSNPDAQDTMKGAGMAIAARLKTTFIDCRDRRAVYQDVYTGFMDRVDMRAISAANLALSERFDDSLRVKPSPEKPITAMDLIVPMLSWIVPIWREITLAMSTGMNARRTRTEKQQAKARRRKENKLYMHPKTVCIYCGTLPTERGSVIVAEEMFSSFDANQVKWRLFPKMDPVMGDGTVPEDSAYPPDDIVTTGIDRNLSKCVEDISHSNLPSEDDVIDKIKAALNDANIRTAWWE